MSELIELYDINANVVKMYSPKVAEGLVESGVLFECPPTIVEEKHESPQKKTVKAKANVKE